MSSKTTSKPKTTTKGKKTSCLSSDSTHVDSTSSSTRTHDPTLHSQLSNIKTKSQGTGRSNEQRHHLTGLCVQPANSDYKQHGYNLSERHVQPVNPDCLQHGYYHTHADRLTALWAWLDNQMHTRVFQPRHSILFEFAAEFLRFCRTNPGIYCVKDENRLKNIHMLTFEEAAVVLHEHLCFHYQTLKCFMQHCEPYVEYIKQLRNAFTLEDVKRVKVRRPPQNCVFSQLERHWDESETKRLIKQN